MKDLRIFLADGHDLLRRGLRALVSLQPGWSICGEARNGADAVRLVLELKPDIVILEFELPELSGIDAVTQIKRALPATEILFYTTHDEEYLIARALRAGAHGHVLKSDSEEKLIEAVTNLAKHMPYFSTTAAETLLAHILKTGEESAAIAVLTGRELKIVQLLGDGKSNKEIASHLQISVKTVEAHRSATMRKLGFKSITELVRYAIRNGLVQP